jgi:Tol biopolymer transport system component
MVRLDRVKRRRVALPAALLATAMLGTAPVAAMEAPFSVTERASVGTGGVQGLRGSGGSAGWSASADCRYVAFSSRAPNWVDGDTAGRRDVFVRDRATDVTEVVSVTGDGRLGNDHSYLADLSPDGRFVLFGSRATNLVPVSTGVGIYQTFIRDRRTDATELVSVTTDGVPANGTSGGASVSADGRYVVFLSAATNLAPNDTDPPGAFNDNDLFLRDRELGTTRLLSRAVEDRPGSVTTDTLSMSDDGRYVLFGSADSHLVERDENEAPDVFVRDLRKGTVRLVSKDSDGRLAGKGGKRGFLSADGRVAAFMTPARFSKHDRDDNSDVYVRRLTTGKTMLASQDVRGASTARAGVVRSASISGGGRYVVFNSQATSLAKGDTDDRYDTFVRDMVAKRTVLVSVGADGSSGPGNAYGGAISRDGSCVAFTAAARSNLVPEDTNRAWDIYLRVRSAR